MMFNPPKRTMLVVDDDRAILKVFSRIFEKNGYSVATAETGREAAEKLETHNYDAALLDLRLPDMSGADLLPRMREISPKMVKIIITGMPEDNSDEVERSGADAFLSKPVEPEFLLNVLDIKLREKKPKP